MKGFINRLCILCVFLLKFRMETVKSENLQNQLVSNSNSQFRNVNAPGGYKVQVIQQQPQTDYETITYRLKFNGNNNNYTQFCLATTVYIKNQSQTFTCAKIFGQWIRITFPKTSDISNSSCIVFTLDQSYLTNYAASYSINSNCQSYINYQEPIPDNGSAGQNISAGQNFLSEAQIGMADFYKTTSTYLNLAFKGSILFGFSSFLCSLLNFLNLITIYYFIPDILIPSRIGYALKSILEGITSNLFLPQDLFDFMSTNLEIDEHLTHFSFTRNFLSFFAESIIMYVAFDLVRRIKNYFSNKTKIYDREIFTILNFIGSFSILSLGVYLNFQTEIKFSNFKDKINLLGFFCLSLFLIAICVCYINLLLQATNKSQVQQLYIGIKRKQKNKKSQKMVILEILILASVPTFVRLNFYVFWITNLMVILMILRYSFDCNSYKNYFIFFVKSITKWVILLHHLSFLLYKESKNENLLQILDQIHFYAILTAFCMQFVNVIVQTLTQVFNLVEDIKNKYFSGAVQDETKETNKKAKKSWFKTKIKKQCVEKPKQQGKQIEIESQLSNISKKTQKKQNPSRVKNTCRIQQATNRNLQHQSCNIFAFVENVISYKQKPQSPSVKLQLHPEQIKSVQQQLHTSHIKKVRKLKNSHTLRTKYMKNKQKQHPKLKPQIVQRIHLRQTLIQKGIFGSKQMQSIQE